MDGLNLWFSIIFCDHDNPVPTEKIVCRNFLAIILADTDIEPI